MIFLPCIIVNSIQPLSPCSYFANCLIGMSLHCLHDDHAECEGSCVLSCQLPVTDHMFPKVVSLVVACTCGWPCVSVTSCATCSLSLSSLWCVLL